MKYGNGILFGQPSIGKSEKLQRRKAVAYLSLAFTLGVTIGMISFCILVPVHTQEGVRTNSGTIHIGRDLDKFLTSWHLSGNSGTGSGTYTPTSPTSVDLRSPWAPVMSGGDLSDGDLNRPVLKIEDLRSQWAPVMSGGDLNHPVLARSRGPPPPRGEGGGGEGDNRDSALRCISGEEASHLLKDWIARTRIYRMTGDFGGDKELGISQTASLERLRLFQTFIDDGADALSDHTRSQMFAREPMPEQVIFALAPRKNPEDIFALAGTFLSRKQGLIAHHLAVKPAELNNEDNVALQKMLYAIYLLADQTNIPVDMEPLFASLPSFERQRLE